MQNYIGLVLILALSQSCMMLQDREVTRTTVLDTAKNTRTEVKLITNGRTSDSKSKVNRSHEVTKKFNKKGFIMLSYKSVDRYRSSGAEISIRTVEKNYEASIFEKKSWKRKKSVGQGVRGIHRELVTDMYGHLVRMEVRKVGGWGFRHETEKITKIRIYRNGRCIKYIITKDDKRIVKKDILHVFKARLLDQDQEDPKYYKLLTVFGNDYGSECKRKGLQISMKQVSFDDCVNARDEFVADRNSPIADKEVYQVLLDIPADRWAEIQKLLINVDTKFCDTTVGYRVKVQGKDGVRTFYLAELGGCCPKECKDTMMLLHRLFASWDVSTHSI